MDLRVLQNFLLVAETLNFRRASEQAFIAQPALSRQIQQLEEELGATLFNRTKRSVTLTPAGVYFRAEAERLLSGFRQSCRRTAEIHRGEAGEIRIGHATSAMQSILPRLLVKIHEQRPGLKVYLNEVSNQEQLDLLANGDLDVGFAPNIVVPPDMDSRVVYEEPFVLILPENHPLTPDTFSNLAQVSHEEFVLPPRPVGAGYVETLFALCREAGFVPRIAYESAHTGSVQRLVEAGLGVSIEPRSTLRGQNLRIRAIELTNASYQVEMTAVWLRDRTAELAPFFALLDWVLPTDGRFPVRESNEHQAKFAS